MGIQPATSACLRVEPLFSFSGKISPKIEIKNSKNKRFKMFSVAKT
jgi:hypothetical protein